MDDLTRLDKENIWHPFTPLQGGGDPPVITDGKGVYLYTADGRKIIDAISSWWVNIHGHGNPKIAEAISAQARRLEHVIFAGFTHEPAIRLSKNLLRILPHQRKIFFSDNGSTAVEVGLKTAMQYWHNLGIQKKKVVAINGAYHGDTFGSMSVAERGMFTKPFFPYLFETSFIDFPKPGNETRVLNQFQDLVKQGDVAAFIFEPLIQAASGMRTYAVSVLDQLLGYAQKADVVTIADEVFTGFGRTGKLFAVDHLTNKPDIIALSKGVTGGFLPLGITASSQKIVDAFDTPALDKTFFHGHSYTANPLSCAAANASFELLMESDCQTRIAHIAAQHATFANSVKNNKNVRDIRVLGTVLALEVETPESSSYGNTLRSRIYPYFLERNILLRPLGNVIYVLPPYVIEEKELHYIYKTIVEFLDEV